MFIDSSNEMLTNEKLLIVSDVGNVIRRERESERERERTREMETERGSEYFDPV